MNNEGHRGERVEGSKVKLREKGNTNVDTHHPDSTGSAEDKAGAVVRATQGSSLPGDQTPPLPTDPLRETQTHTHTITHVDSLFIGWTQILKPWKQLECVYLNKHPIRPLRSINSRCLR